MISDENSLVFTCMLLSILLMSAKCSDRAREPNNRCIKQATRVYLLPYIAASYYDSYGLPLPAPAAASSF